MINSKKLALAWLEHLGEIKFNYGVIAKPEDFEFIEKKSSKSTSSRYYHFVTNKSFEYNHKIIGGGIVNKNEYFAIVVRISDHADYLNSCGSINEEEFEGYTLSINDIGWGETKEEAIEMMDVTIF